MQWDDHDDGDDDDSDRDDDGDDGDGDDDDEIVMMTVAMMMMVMVMKSNLQSKRDNAFLSKNMFEKDEGWIFNCDGNLMQRIAYGRLIF